MRSLPVAVGSAWLAGIGLLFLLIGVPVWPSHGQAAEEDPELARLRAQIAASRVRVVEHEREERDLVELLEEVDRGMDEMDLQVDVSERDWKAAQERVVQIDSELQTLESRMRETRSLMSKRAVALYKAGAEGPLRLLFASEDLRALFSKLWNLERILESDSELLARFRSQWLELEGLHAEALKARTEVASTRTRLASRREALESEKADAWERPPCADAFSQTDATSTREAASRLTAAFRHRETRKIYWALVAGVPHPYLGEIKYGLVKAAGHGRGRDRLRPSAARAAA